MLALVISLLMLMPALGGCSEERNDKNTGLEDMEWADDLPELDYKGGDR